MSSELTEGADMEFEALTNDSADISPTELGISIKLTNNMLAILVTTLINRIDLLSAEIKELKERYEPSTQATDNRMNPGLRQQIEDNLAFYSDANLSPHFAISAIRYVRDVRALLSEIDRLELMIKVVVGDERGWIGEAHDNPIN